MRDDDGTPKKPLKSANCANGADEMQDRQNRCD